MKLKTIDNVFDVCLWGVFIALVVGSWILADTIDAPKFEVVNSEIRFPYEYTTKDGNRVESTYQLAWKHEQFSKPQIVVYDSSNGSWNTIKDEYIEEYKAVMPPSEYPFWTRWFWIIFAVFVIISAVVTYYVGGVIRDTVLYLTVISRNTFADCSYFLYHDRMCFTKQVRENITNTIDKYIATQSETLYRRYVPTFAKLVIQLLNEIKMQKDTRIGFYYSYLDNTKNHMEYLKDLSAYWHSQIGIHERAEQNQDYIDTLRQKSYVNLSIGASASEFVSVVSDELKKLFSEVMGEEVFNFEAYQASYADLRKMPGAIFVTTTVENSLNSFTWSGHGYEGQLFPGVAVRFTIYHYENGQKIILWNKYLDPKTTYRAEENALVVKDLYRNMIMETIRSFPESLKSKKE